MPHELGLNVANWENPVELYVQIFKNVMSPPAEILPSIELHIIDLSHLLFSGINNNLTYKWHDSFLGTPMFALVRFQSTSLGMTVQSGPQCLSHSPAMHLHITLHNLLRSYIYSFECISDISQHLLKL